MSKVAVVYWSGTGNTEMMANAVAEGLKDCRAFLYGVLSGVVEPVGGFLTILAVSYVTSFLPYFLSFAACAMLYVVVEELIPEMRQGEHSNIGTLFFCGGFFRDDGVDVALG